MIFLQKVKVLLLGIAQLTEIEKYKTRQENQWRM